MTSFDTKSFALGIATGLVIILAYTGAMHLLEPQRAVRMMNGGQMMNGNGQFGRAPNLSRMAERFGMTEADLQKELRSGKSMQDIAAEHGVTMGNIRNRNGSGAMATGSGATRSVTSSSSSSAI